MTTRKADYVARKTWTPKAVDADVRHGRWSGVGWSPRFVDMVDGRPGMYDTRVAVLWDDENLYVAFVAEEPFVTAHQNVRDSIVFLENDLELFIDGGDCYYELEVNAANTVYEVFFIWKDSFSQPRFDRPEFDVHHPGTYTFGGDYDRSGAHFWKGTHPRGIRWAFTNFDMPGLETAVAVDGSLNDDSDTDRGWSWEVSIPWTSLTLLANGRSLPPRPGDEWTMFLGRFQKLTVSGAEIQPHPATALTSHGEYDTHRPECWSVIRFEE